MKTCSHCERPARARGLCTMHYRRMRRGSPMDAPVQEKGAPVTYKKKVCVQCLVEKRLEEFCRHSTTRDGRGSWCMECKRKYNRGYRRPEGSVVRGYGVDQVAQRWLLGFPSRVTVSRAERSQRFGDGQ